MLRCPNLPPSYHTQSPPHSGDAACPHLPVERTFEIGRALEFEVFAGPLAPLPFILSSSLCCLEPPRNYPTKTTNEQEPSSLPGRAAAPALAWILALLGHLPAWWCRNASCINSTRAYEGDRADETKGATILGGKPKQNMLNTFGAYSLILQGLKGRLGLTAKSAMRPGTRTLPLT